MVNPEINERKNYIWNMLGSVVSALISTMLLLMATRLLNAQTSDLFGITYSLGQQLLIIGLFQVREYQAIDVRETFSFSTYMLTRILTIFLMLVSAVAFIMINQYDLNKSLVFLFLVLCRACDAFSDVYQGLYQQKSRSDLAGKILFFRSIAIISFFGLTLIISQSLLIACVTIFCINFLLLFLLDFRYYKKLQFSYNGLTNREQLHLIKRLLKTCFPLFLNGFLITYIFNEPKLVIDNLLTKGHLQAGLQRDFNVLFMPTFIMSLLLMILRPLITRLSDLWLQKCFQQFYKQFQWLTAILATIGIVIMISGYWIGTEILGILYGITLTHYKLEFVILLLGGIFNILAAIIGNMMTIFRKQASLVIVYIITFIVSKLVTGPLVTQYGMFGASLSFVVSMFIFLMTSFMIYIVTKNSMMKTMR